MYPLISLAMPNATVCAACALANRCTEYPHRAYWTPYFDDINYRSMYSEEWTLMLVFFV